MGRPTTAFAANSISSNKPSTISFRTKCYFKLHQQPQFSASSSRIVTHALPPEYYSSIGSSSQQSIPAFDTVPPDFITPNTLTVADLSIANSVTNAPSQTFEAVAPDPSLFIGMGSVVLLCIAAGFVWANDVVPVSRTKLAISKNRGEVREYLEGLKTITSSELTNATILSRDDNEIVQDQLTDGNIQNQRINPQDNLIKPNVGDGRDFERWLFSDWLNNNKSAGKGRRKKEPALPILKQAKWNSGDNPVLFTAAIMMVGIVLASVTERIGTV